MKSIRLKAFIVVGVLLAVTGLAMKSLSRSQSAGNGQHQIRTVQPQAASAPSEFPVSAPKQLSTEDKKPLVVSAQLVQEKFLVGGDGRVKLWLTLKGDEIEPSEEQSRQSVDMVVVLDRSGSMRGSKIQYARAAVLDLLGRLSSRDRLALLGYNDDVVKYAELTPLTDSKHERFRSLVTSITPDGGTNLGDGLQEGIHTLLSRKELTNRGKVVLISDGLANQGITSLDALGNIASIAAEKAFAISTIGVGNDFNEQLMTVIADRGVGNYYYLDNLQAFAEVFEKEFYQSTTAAAHAIEIRVPLPKGTSLIEASGYPISVRNNEAIVHYGDLGSGQSRRLFLTFQFPTRKETSYSLQGINFSYLHQDTQHNAAFPEAFELACVRNRQEVIASTDAVGYALGSYQVDNNIFETRIAADLKKGNKHAALRSIEEYAANSRALFDRLVAEGKITEEIQQLRDAEEKEIAEWRTIVEQSFTGSEQEKKAKQKSNSKFLQFKAYKGQRDKK